MSDERHRAQARALLEGPMLAWSDGLLSDEEMLDALLAALAAAKGAQAVYKCALCGWQPPVGAHMRRIGEQFFMREGHAQCDGRRFLRIGAAAEAPPDTLQVIYAEGASTTISQGSDDGETWFDKSPEDASVHRYWRVLRLLTHGEGG